MDLNHLLGAEAESLLNYSTPAISKDLLTLPGPDFLDEVFLESDRTPTVLRSLGTLYNHGRLGGTGYLSILPVDQGIEHSGAASFAKVPKYFNPADLCELAIAGDCSAIATTLGVLKSVSRRYVHKMPFIVKLNHNDWLHYPNTYDQIMFSSPQQAADLGAVGVGATIYFGSKESDRQLQEVAAAFEEAHRLGMFTVLWCYRHHWCRHHQAEAGGVQRWLQRRGLRQDRPEGLQRTDDGSPHRPHEVASGELLRRSHWAHQLRWRVQG